MKGDILKDAARETPDPERALKNLSTFIQENPSFSEKLISHVHNVSMLFSHSQFMANYCTANPDSLFSAIDSIDEPFNREKAAAGFSALMESEVNTVSGPHLNNQMLKVRQFRMREQLRITLRDILNKADIVDIMLDLSGLADVVISGSLDAVRRSLDETYGRPLQDSFSVISLGKLGGEELNFSSDVDLIYVYRTEEGETSGISTRQKIVKNRISNHEYYCRLGESLGRFLSQNTEAGFAYRVDLRLRPEGQRGDIALALRGYEMYYESWGRAWERAMLLRARPMAGDVRLGMDFMEMIRPFVFRKYLDFSSIDEIRKLKARIDSTFKRGDLKRGYGGIREIEFFVQALQLIYGGKEPLLRERSILKALHRLLQKALIGQTDYSALTESYRYLRKLEHRLQQVNDLQTHTIPSGPQELDALGQKMGFIGQKDFLEDLELKRKSVRTIYDSLFVGKKEDQEGVAPYLDEELSDAELAEYLRKTGISDIGKAMRNIKGIRASTLTFQTLRGRRLLGAILPDFIDAALRSAEPDITLNHLQSFAGLLGSYEPYTEIFQKNRELIDVLTNVFSQSEYLSKMLLRRPQHLESVVWQERPKKSLRYLIDEINGSIKGGAFVNDAVRLFKQTEEIRLGLMFLEKGIDVVDVVKGLSKTAEAILSTCLSKTEKSGKGLSVIGFGKLGGREISFNSDLDLIFVSVNEVRESATNAAEKLLRMLSAYTKEGIAYRVDTRLRPDGSKGPLVSPVKSFSSYYERGAAFWEYQALLKARPVAGDVKTGLEFIAMAQAILVAKGPGISASDVRQMRGRIVKELAKTEDGYDIKLGEGGLEEIEFTVQYLQLKNCSKDKRLLIQNTLSAVRRLKDAGTLHEKDADILGDAYLFYRTLEGFLRLKGEDFLRKDEKLFQTAASFMDFRSTEKFISHIKQLRERVSESSERYLRDQTL